MTSAQTWDTAAPPALGALGGECFRAFCRVTGANWYHGKANRYYCESCATEINTHAWLKGEPPPCSRQS